MPCDVLQAFSLRFLSVVCRVGLDAASGVSGGSVAGRAPLLYARLPCIGGCVVSPEKKEGESPKRDINEEDKTAMAWRLSRDDALTSAEAPWREKEGSAATRRRTWQGSGTIQEFSWIFAQASTMRLRFNRAVGRPRRTVSRFASFRHDGSTAEGRNGLLHPKSRFLKSNKFL